MFLDEVFLCDRFRFVILPYILYGCYKWYWMWGTFNSKSHFPKYKRVKLDICYTVLVTQDAEFYLSIISPWPSNEIESSISMVSLFVCFDHLLLTQAKKTWSGGNHVFWLLRQWLLDMLECMLTFAPSAKTPGGHHPTSEGFSWAPWHYLVMYMRHKPISHKKLILPQI